MAHGFAPKITDKKTIAHGKMTHGFAWKSTDKKIKGLWKNDLRI